MKKRAVRLLLALLLFVVLLALTGCFYTVRENRFAVVTQFGRIVNVESSAGLKLKIPVIQSISYLPKEIQIYDLSPSDVITKDKKSMIADNYVLWRVADPIKYIRTLDAIDIRAEERIEAAVYNALKNVISSMTVTSLSVSLRIFCASASPCAV